MAVANDTGWMKLSLSLTLGSLISSGGRVYAYGSQRIPAVINTSERIIALWAQCTESCIGERRNFCRGVCKVNAWPFELRSPMLCAERSQVELSFLYCYCVPSPRLSASLSLPELNRRYKPTLRLRILIKCTSMFLYFCVQTLLCAYVYFLMYVGHFCFPETDALVFFFFACDIEKEEVFVVLFFLSFCCWIRKREK